MRWSVGTMPSLASTPSISRPGATSATATPSCSRCVRRSRRTRRPRSCRSRTNCQAGLAGTKENLPPATFWRPRRSGSSLRTGCGRTRRRACASGCRRGGPPPTRPAAANTGAPTDVGVAYDPAGRRILLAMITRSQVNDPKAQNLRPLIAELTALAIPLLLS